MARHNSDRSKLGEPQYGDYDWGVGEVGSQPGRTQARQKSLAVPILVGVICVLVAVILVGYFVFFFPMKKDDVLGDASVRGSISSDSAANESILEDEPKYSTVEGSEDSVAPCAKLPLIPVLDSGLILRSEDREMAGATYSSFCDGKWANTEYGKMTWGGLWEWNGKNWKAVPYDIIFSEGFIQGYYWRRTLRDLGAENAIGRSYIDVCDGKTASQLEYFDAWAGNRGDLGDEPTPVAAFSGLRGGQPDCDGRAVLVTHTVRVPEGQDAQRKVASSLAYFPGAEFARPGACPSLPAVDEKTGDELYYIYYDHGVEGGCEGSREHGLSYEVRLLNNTSGVEPELCS